MTTETVNIIADTDIRDAVGRVGYMASPSFSFYIDDSDTVSWHGFGARFEGIDLTGISSLTSATITFVTHQTSPIDGGSEGRIEVRVEDSNDPADWDETTNQPQDRLASTLTPGVEYDAPNSTPTSPTRVIDVTALVQALLDEGYTYDGTAGNSVMHFLFGGNNWFSTGHTVSYRLFADRWADGDPADYELAIVYDEAAGGGGGFSVINNYYRKLLAGG